MNLVSTIWVEMFGSGVATGVATGIAVHIAHQAKPTHRARIRVAPAFCVVVVGATMRSTVVLRIVATTFRRPLTAIAASVLFVSLSLRANGSKNLASNIGSIMLWFSFTTYSCSYDIIVCPFTIRLLSWIAESRARGQSVYNKYLWSIKSRMNGVINSIAPVALFNHVCNAIYLW